MSAPTVAAPTPAAAQRPGLGVLAASTAVVVWGASSVVIKQIEGLNGLGVGFYRLWIGMVLTVGLFTATGGRVTKRLVRLSLVGGIAFLADIVLFFSAVQATSVANATVLGALQPILVLAIAGPLFGERPHLSDGIWSVVAISGAAVVVFGGDAGGATSRHGDLLALAALLAWTWYFVASKTARGQLGSFEYLTGLSIVAAVGVVPMPFLLGQPLGTPDARGWALLTFLAVVNGALGHFLMNWSHAHVPLVAVSLLTLAIPVVAAATAWLFIDEPLVALQVMGMSVVVVALGVVSIRSARRQPVTSEAEVAAIETLPSP